MRGILLRLKKTDFNIFTVNLAALPQVPPPQQPLQQQLLKRKKEEHLLMMFGGSFR